MIHWWDAFWMLAAAFAWVPVRRISPEANRRLGALGLAVAAFYFVIATFGWSVRGDAVDPYVDAPLVFLIALGGMAFFQMLRRPWSTVLMGGLATACLAFWGLLFAARVFSGPPIDARGDLPDGHRYTAKNLGLAVPRRIVRTEVFHIPQWLPIVERRVGVSVIEGEEYGPGAAGARADFTVKDGRRTLRVTSSGVLVGEVNY